MSDFYGLIGEKLTHSISPKIHNIIFEKLYLRGSYNLFQIKRENLKEAIQGLKVLGCKGVNVTIPYKIEIIKYLDCISKEVEKIGAVNTIAFNDGVVKGYNTDYHGFGASLKNENIAVHNKNAVILGTGGASKAVLHYLLDNGVKNITYVSRKVDEIKEGLEEFKVIGYEDLETLKNNDIIINCTPCGMYPNIECSPVNKNVLSEFSVAVDLIYNPKETIFLKEARKIGIKTVNGLYMLTAQAVAAQEIWQGIKISEEITKNICGEL